MTPPPAAPAPTPTLETRLGWAEKSIARVKAALAPWADEFLDLDDQDAGYMAERVAARLKADEADQDLRWANANQAVEDRDAAILESRAALQALAKAHAALAAPPSGAPTRIWQLARGRMMDLHDDFHDGSCGHTAGPFERCQHPDCKLFAAPEEPTR